MEQTLLEMGGRDVHVLRQDKAALKLTRGNAPVDEFASLVRLCGTAANKELPFLNGNGEVFRREARDRERDPVSIRTVLRDIERREAVRPRSRGPFYEPVKLVEPQKQRMGRQRDA